MSAQSLFVSRTVNLPNTLEMHRSNFDNMPCLLALENTVATSTRHTSDVQELRTVNHMVVLSPSNANAVRFNLEAQAALVLPQSRGDPRLHTVRCDLSSGVERVLELLATACWWGLRSVRIHRWQRQSLRNHLVSH